MSLTEAEEGLEVFFLVEDPGGGEEEGEDREDQTLRRTLRTGFAERHSG